MPPPGGYFRWPSLHGETLLFVCEDDLYAVPLSGGVPRRITDAPGPVRRPIISPDGTTVAFTVVEEECQEIYACSVHGGPLSQITFQGADFARVAAWAPDGSALFFVSSAGQPFPDVDELWYAALERVGDDDDDDSKSKSKSKSIRAGEPSRANLGPAYDAAFQPGGRGRLLGRNTEDPAVAHWKGYRGGCVGDAWIDRDGDGAFARLRLRLEGDEDDDGRTMNVGDFSWATRDVLVFAADDGGGRTNLYSCRLDEGDEGESGEERGESGVEDAGASSALSALSATSASSAPSSSFPVLSVTARRHTARTDFCVRHVCPDRGASPDADSVEVAYVAGGRLFRSTLRLSPGASPATAGIEIPVDWRGPRAQMERRRLEDPESYLEHWGLHPEGLTALVVARGRAFSMGLWDGPALEYPPVREGDDASDAAGSTAGASSLASSSSSSSPNPKLRALAARADPRARLATYLWDARRVAVISDASGEDDVEIHHEDGSKGARRLFVPPDLLGRPESIAASPEAPLLAVVNHRATLLIVDAETGAARVADASDEENGIVDACWSPCGCWLAYAKYVDPETSVIRLLDVRDGVARDATRAVLGDASPGWDPEGKYLYFLSSRELEPTYDAHGFGMSFRAANKPHALALRADVRNPLLRQLRPPHDGASSDDEEDDSDLDSDAYDSDDSRADAPPPIEIEFEGLLDRVVALPMPAGRYANLLGLDDGRFMVVRFPSARPTRVGLDAPYYAEGSDDSDDDEDGSASTGALLRFDVGRLKTATLIDAGVRSVDLSMDRRCMLVEKVVSGETELRAHKAGAKPEDEDSDGEEIDDDAFDRASGLLDLEGRLRIVVDPAKEWAQMLGETWRRLRDDWWDPDMAFGDAAAEQTVVDDDDERTPPSTANATRRLDSSSEHQHRADWNGILGKYAGVLPRVASRSEFADVMHEMAAELRSSHVSVHPGDASGETRRRRSQLPGRLGCDVRWDESAGGYRVVRVVGGDAWDDLTGGALRKPGVNVEVGDVLTRIDRVRLTKAFGPSEALVGKGGKEILLTRVRGAEGGEGGGANALADRVGAMRVRDDARGGAKKAAGKKNAGGSDSGSRRSGSAAAAKRPKEVSVRVRAMHSELDARYRDMIRDRADRVHALGGGAVGYLHLPDMERFGYSEFWRRYAAESRRRALVVDFRGNVGGHISELILAKLAQRPLAWDVPRRGAPESYPSHAAGPVVALVDENTGSDAELAAAAFRRLGLGAVVGARTWGGLLTVGDGATLVDGGEVSAPSRRVVLFDDEKGGDEGGGVAKGGGVGKDGGVAKSASAKAKGWNSGNASSDSNGSSRRPANDVENRGVTPDVEVTISPGAHARGEDPQLDAAVAEALRLARERPPPPRPARATAPDEDAAKAAARRAGGGRWPFKVFAPYPEESDEDSEEDSEEESDDESPPPRRKPKGARPRR